MPVRQNAHAMAQPTWVEMQKVIAGVSGMNTDSIWCRRRGAGETSRCRRRIVPRDDDAGVVDGEVRRRSAVAQRVVAGRSSPSNVGHAVAIDPPEYLTGAKPLEAALFEGGFERRAFQLGEVERTLV